MLVHVFLSAFVAFSAAQEAPPWLAPVTLAPLASEDPGYVLHEWGTFTTVAGSDGVLLEGLTYDDHQLPDFVYERSTSEPGFSGMSCKMETPVIYFYSDRPRELRVKVAFQQGVLTQWYPQVHQLYPPAGPEPLALRGGVLDWGRIQLLGPGEGVGELPGVGSAFHWEHARAVDANVIVRHTPFDQHERFLFYRGLGSFALPLAVWTDGDGGLNMSNMVDDPLPGLIVLSRRGQSLRAMRLPALSRGTPAHVLPAELPAIELPALMELTARLLEEQGLYPLEALAMVNTWQQSYFETDGLRVLYPLPRGETDWLLPLSVSPAPRESVRVLVGRTDVLTREAEQAALAALPLIRTPDQARAHFGRFALPLLHRLTYLTEDVRERDHVLELVQLLEQAF